MKEGRASSGLDRSTSGATALSNGSASYRKRWSSNASGGDAYVNYGNGSGMNQEKGMISPDGDRLSTTSIYSSEIPYQSYRPNDYTQPTPQQQNYTTSNSEGHEESINRSSIDQSTMDHSMAYSEGMTAATTGSSSYHTNNGFLPPPPSIPHNRALGRCDSTMSVVEPTQSFGVLRIANVTEED